MYQRRVLWEDGTRMWEMEMWTVLSNSIGFTG